MEDFYRRYDEGQRLAPDSLECVRTLDILQRYLPPPPAVIYDVGGATGIYAIPLAERGYEVHLIDALEHHVAQTAEISRRLSTPLASCKAGDARQLDVSDGTADAVLLLGPLYHLLTSDDRVKALTEALRILRPGGQTFVAAISRFAYLMYGFARDLIGDPTFVQMVMQDLQDGHHRNLTGNLRHFTDAYFHLPEGLREEVARAGFNAPRLIGIEGPFWNVASLPGWSIPESRRIIVDLLQQVEEQPSLLGASSHILAIASRGTD